MPKPEMKIEDSRIVVRLRRIDLTYPLISSDGIRISILVSCANMI